MNDQLILRQGEHPVTIITGDDPYVLICDKSLDDKMTYPGIAVPHESSIPTREEAVILRINGLLDKSKNYWVKEGYYGDYFYISGDTGLVMSAKSFDAFNIILVRRIPIVEAE